MCLAIGTMYMQCMYLGIVCMCKKTKMHVSSRGWLDCTLGTVAMCLFTDGTYFCLWNLTSNRCALSMCAHTFRRVWAAAHSFITSGGLFLHLTLSLYVYTDLVVHTFYIQIKVLWVLLWKQVNYDFLALVLFLNNMMCIVFNVINAYISCFHSICSHQNTIFASVLCISTDCMLHMEIFHPFLYMKRDHLHPRSIYLRVIILQKLNPSIL